MPAETSVYDMLFDRILESEFDAIQLTHVKTASFLWSYLHSSPLIQKFLLPHSLIHLNGSFASYMNEFSPKARKNRHREIRRVSTTLRQVLTKFSEFFVCWIRMPSFSQESSRQDRVATTIGNSVDPQHPCFCRFSGAFRFFKSRSLRFICILPQAAFPEWTPAC